jgi:hypothetical protein
MHRDLYLCENKYKLWLEYFSFQTCKLSWNIDKNIYEIKIISFFLKKEVDNYIITLNLAKGVGIGYIQLRIYGAFGRDPNSLKKCFRW